MVWCGSTEVYREASDVHSTIEKFEKGLEESHPDILPSMIYAYAAIKLGIPYANGAPNLSADIPASSRWPRRRARRSRARTSRRARR
jgi:myo-inositol-1-phosphate synthase